MRISFALKKKLLRNRWNCVYLKILTYCIETRAGARVFAGVGGGGGGAVDTFFFSRLQFSPQ